MTIGFMNIAYSMVVGGVAFGLIQKKFTGCFTDGIAYGAGNGLVSGLMISLANEYFGNRGYWIAIGWTTIVTCNLMIDRAHKLNRLRQDNHEFNQIEGGIEELAAQIGAVMALQVNG